MGRMTLEFVSQLTCQLQRPRNWRENDGEEVGRCFWHVQEGRWWLCDELMTVEACESPRE
jgi:hypothetical protein